MTVQTRVDLSKYAQDIEVEANKASGAGERASADELVAPPVEFKKVAAQRGGESRRFSVGRRQRDASSIHADASQVPRRDTAVDSSAAR